MLLLWCAPVERIIIVLASRIFDELQPVVTENSLTLSVPKTKLLVRR